MAAAHMASATIRKIQHDMHTRARSSSGALDDARLKADDKESDSGRSTREENGVALHSASSSPSDHTMSAENPIETSTAARFCPMDSSTPTKRIRNVTRNNDHHNQQQQIPNSSSSSSTIDTESTDSPLTGEIPHMSGPFATVSSQTQPFKAPIVGYEILEERVKFTVFKIHVQHIPTRRSWFVFRRYTDFARLDRKIRSLFPQFRLCLPPKRWFRDNFDPSFLQKRLEGLGKFVDDLLSHAEAYNCIHVRDFFCFDDPPGPHDCLQESRLQCESLEDQLAALRLELGEKLAEIDVVKAELTLVKAQRESLLKSLSRECSIVSMVNGSDKSLDNVPALRRTHLINVSVVQMMQKACLANANHVTSNANTTVPPVTNLQRFSFDEQHLRDDEIQQNHLENSGLYMTVVHGSEERDDYKDEYVTCVMDRNQSYYNGIQISDGVRHYPGNDRPYDGGGVNKGNTKAAPSMDDNGNQTFGKLLDNSVTS